MKFKIRSFTPELTALALLVGLPLVGILAGDMPLARYLEFPPQTHYVEHAGSSWPVWIGLALLILSAILPFIIRILFFGDGMLDQDCSAPRCGAKFCGFTESPHAVRRYTLPMTDVSPAARRFPIWGWVGLFFGIIAWILAWSRFTWFAPLQAFTFSPLWFAYIIIVNALTWRRTGQCMLTHRIRYFILLFPVSALFWWFFEYLNRFVQNWYYVGISGLTSLEYFLYATLPFATILPAVMGTCDLLASYPRLYAGLTRFRPLAKVHSRLIAAVVLALSVLGLAGIGMWPDYLFPILWLAPLGILASMQFLAGRTTLFADLVRGDWRRIVLLALSALICGFFWEMWNFYSLAKWIYAVPFVNRFHIFEMPVLGYAGYLPFGLECALIADRVACWCERHSPQKFVCP